jgi:hypothetical protein
MFRFLFKIPQHKTFSHTPIYFDPEKEELKRRAASNEGDDHAPRKVARGSLKESWGRSARNAKSTRASNIRLIFIILFLGLLAWLFFYY